MPNLHSEKCDHVPSSVACVLLTPPVLAGRPPSPECAHCSVSEPFFIKPPNFPACPGPLPTTPSAFAHMCSHLRHPNVVLFMGACTTPGHLAIVTEYMAQVRAVASRIARA